jgi:hypothetical protein
MNTLMMIHNSNDNKNYFTASSLVSLLKSTSQFFHVGTEGNNGNNKHPTIPTVIHQPAPLTKAPSIVKAPSLTKAPSIVKAPALAQAPIFLKSPSITKGITDFLPKWVKCIHFN